MSPFTRDVDAYWKNRPADHNTVGLFVDGPQPAEPITNKLARLTRSRCDERPEGPLGATQRMAREREHRLSVVERRLAFVRAVQGKGSFVKGLR
jgi:hypothetical protein